ncbi:MAG: cysteine desulfurase [Muribaculaceae bacterium]|nr:cysteine desulfurase [Muribaculaceae bacterium]
MDEIYNVRQIREQFPALGREINGRPLVYLDNTATSQTPQRVLDAVREMYVCHKANVHRGVHTLSQEATDLQERTRRHLARYINAVSECEVIFTRGATESINLVASSFGSLLPEEGEIILTVMEHHANIVPWQLLCSRKPGLSLRVVDINERGELDTDQYRRLFNPRTVMAAFTHVSNVLGTINPVEEMTAIAHAHGVPVLIDGAQASPHLRLDMQRIGCDFYVFSSHKMYGPAGIGVLYGREELLERMPPYQGGGEMIGHVSFSGTTFADLPFKFEAGTPDFVGIAAFDEALNFLETTGLENIERHEEKLLHIATEGLKEIVPDVRIFGEAPQKSAVLSFLIGNEHPYDFGMLLDGLGIAVRTGHHCAQPLMERLGIPGTVRASFAAYNTEEEVREFLKGVERVASMLG